MSLAPPPSAASNSLVAEALARAQVFLIVLLQPVLRIRIRIILASRIWIGKNLQVHVSGSRVQKMKNLFVLKTQISTVENKMLGSYPKAFSQGYFTKWQLPNFVISQAATSLDSKGLT